MILGGHPYYPTGKKMKCRQGKGFRQIDKISTTKKARDFSRASVISVIQGIAGIFQSIAEQDCGQCTILSKLAA